MNVSICLDQYASNYNLNALSSNGFSIYTDLDNFTTPIAQGIPYQNLFSAPIGNCPYLLTNVPSGALQLLVIDSCTTNPILPGTTIPTSQELLIDCCYALIDIPQTPPIPPTTSSFCTTCSLDFDVFSSSFVGQIIAGNLTSACGSVTDYTIGWYKDGDYSSPEFVSGYGNAFLPYQLTHPLAGNTAPYVTAGDWEGIIHDIAINGVTYSSISGSANGTPIQFESCFGTIVVAPLTCNNGTFPLPYTHQKTFNAAGNGATPPVIGATYVLSDTTDYFAYRFDAYEVFDELEIKFISGDPNNTGNPSLYSQPIYLEKAKIGSFGFSSNIGNYALITNNTYPKAIKSSFYKRILTLTNISRSANPSLPDSLEIKITSNPANPQTSWKLQMQCLDTFNCSDCFNTSPELKINSFYLDKLCCKKQKLNIVISGSCEIINNDIWSLTSNTNSSVGYTLGNSTLYEKFSNTSIFNESTGQFNTTSSIGCAGPQSGGGSTLCSLPTPNSTISYHKSVGMISMSFNNSVDYLHYKDALEAALNSLNSGFGVANFNFNPTEPQYYSHISVLLPSTNIPCGDFAPFYNINIHPLSNITYTETPSNNYWAIEISLLSITNGIIPSNCSNCYNAADNALNSINISYFNYNFNLINTYGSKKQFPCSITTVVPLSTNPPISLQSGFSSLRQMPYYSWNTLPFVSSSNGWVNLPTLGANPCPSLVSSSMPYASFPSSTSPSNGYSNYGYESQYFFNFPNLPLDSNWFQVYTGVTSSNGYHVGPSQFYPTPGYMIYEHSASIGTVYSSSYFVNGAPIVTIEPWPNC
jgi:hypothetical protein